MTSDCTQPVLPQLTPARNFHIFKSTYLDEQTKYYRRPVIDTDKRTKLDENHTVRHYWFVTKA